jgi:hypothetical protein
MSVGGCPISSTSLLVEDDVVEDVGEGEGGMAGLETGEGEEEAEEVETGEGEEGAAAEVDAVEVVDAIEIRIDLQTNCLLRTTETLSLFLDGIEDEVTR